MIRLLLWFFLISSKTLLICDEDPICGECISKNILGIGNNIGSLYKHVSIRIDDTSVSEYLLRRIHFRIFKDYARLALNYYFSSVPRGTTLSDVSSNSHYKWQLQAQTSL